MVQPCYPFVINRLLRKYLKFNKLPEFERLASYSDLWKTNDDTTFAIRALMKIRNGEKSLDQYQLGRIQCHKKRTRIENHVKLFISNKVDDYLDQKGSSDEETEFVGVKAGQEPVDYNWENRHHFRQLMDSTITVSVFEPAEQLPKVDYKNGSGYPTQRAMLLFNLNPLKFKHQNHAGVLDQIRAIQHEEAQLEYQKFKEMFKHAKHI